MASSFFFLPSPRPIIRLGPFSRRVTLSVGVKCWLNFAKFFVIFNSIHRRMWSPAADRVPTRHCCCWQPRAWWVHQYVKNSSILWIDAWKSLTVSPNLLGDSCVLSVAASLLDSVWKIALPRDYALIKIIAMSSRRMLISSPPPEWSYLMGFQKQNSYPLSILHHQSF